jgi:hypothetical protein
MNRRPSALACAALALLAIAAMYACVARNGIPRPSSMIGLTLGTLGLLLMLSTEFAYSLRKRVRGFNFGRMSTWLELHIFTGIVGAFLVVLHSGGKFQGLAGVALVLTLAIVASGFIGRYVYTAMPRTLEGAELTVQEMEEHIARLDEQLQVLGISLLGEQALADAMQPPRSSWLLVLARPILRWRHRRRLRRAVAKLTAVERARVTRLESLLADRYRLLLQIEALPFARRLLSIWHLAHVPRGIVLFTLAFVHVVGALDYSTFMR